MIEMDNLKKLEDNVTSFIDTINNSRLEKKQMDDFENSDTFKYRCIEKEKEKAREECIKHILCKTFKRSIPLNDEYKDTNEPYFNDQLNAFILKRSPKGILYYIHEGRKKGSPICRKICESVDTLVDSLYYEREMNVKEYTPKDMIFRMDDDTEKKLDFISSNLELDDISKIIQDNVKKTVSSELSRAKEQKQKYEDFEKELADDLSVRTESAIEEMLELHGFKKKRNFVPSLFNGIMIGKLSSPYNESASNNFGTLKMYGYIQKPDENGQYNSTKMEEAFLESVQELTIWNMTKALGLERFTIPMLKNISQDYASGKF